jgi:Phosphorylated CTD interacting factor 1 WW domain
MSLNYCKYIKYNNKCLNLKQHGGSNDNDNNNDLIKKLAREYARYQVVQKILKTERNQKYWASVERLMILMANEQSDNRKDEVFLDIPTNHTYYSSILQLSQYKFVSFNEAAFLVKKIKKKIMKFIKKTEFPIPKKYGNDEYTYYCGDYEITANKERIDALRRFVKPEYKKDVDLLILILILRYECIVGNWQQWGMTSDWYKYLYENENVRIEGFTSPLYSRLMLLGSDIQYCSLFYDTDKYFGSLGNVFNVDFENLAKQYKENVGIVLVPPFSHYIVKEAMKMILKFTELVNNITFFLTVINIPEAYEYSRYYRKLMLSENNLYYRKLTKDQWFFENNMITSDEKTTFYWGRELYVYVLGNKDRKRNYHPMLKRLLDSKEVNEKYKKYEKILEKEYARYKYVQQILGLSANYEWGNIVERFLNSMANVKINEREDQVFIDLPKSHYIYQKMESEMKEKYIKDNFVDEVKKLVEEFLNKKIYDKIIRYGQHQSTYYCDDFSEKTDKLRELALIKMASNVGLGSYYNILILIMMIRYACISAGSQNWNWPYKFFDHIHSKYQVTFEGFASPLNSQLLLLSDEMNYCSLFIDTDEIFGSKGSLFELDIKKYMEEKNITKLSIVLNPPYIEHLMKDMVDLIDKWFSIVSELRVFTGLPYWKDSESLHRLENHKQLKFKQILGPDEYYYEDSLNEVIPKIYHKGKLEIFVLANFDKDPDEPKYSSITKKFKPPIVLE